MWFSNNEAIAFTCDLSDRLGDKLNRNRNSDRLEDPYRGQRDNVPGSDGFLPGEQKLLD